jgi:hydrogenase-4 component B
MNAIQLLLLSVTIIIVGAIVSLALNRSSRGARVVSGIFGALASVVGCIAAILALAGDSAVLVVQGPLPFGQFILQMDGLSAFMVAIISLIGLATSIYSISYLEEYADRSLSALGFFNNLFIGSMILVVTVANAFYFLIFWEVMTLASYFLVIFEQEKKESIEAGYLYMLVAHAGTALIMMAFFGFYLKTGSFDFATFRLAQLSPAVKNVIFLLAFFGFGAKAGIVPLHIWLPRAHPAAPSHVSALLSGVMIKTAIYGILRICVDILGAPSGWWGVTILAFGALSAILGVLYALTEKDLKRMLAYSSVENIGIILMGVGVGMIGVSARQPILAILGFLAALYHLANHAFFKGLLFLGAGSISFRVHTKNLNLMGGLVRRMPWTALAFLTGALAVSAIPPFNGFVSEWFTYQSFFTASGIQTFAFKAIGPLSAVLLALTGALAAMTFIKAYGGAFTGPPHSQGASQATEAPPGMVASTTFLAVGCLILGLAAPLIAPVISRIAANIANVAPQPVANGVWVYPVQSTQAILSTPLTAILLIGLLVVPLVVVALFGGSKAGRRVSGDPWACGYGYAPQMSISASSFDQPMKVTFRPLYSLRIVVQKPLNAIAAWSRRATGTISHMEPAIENIITRPLGRAMDYIGRHVQALQMGDLRMYCLYIILTLAILLIVTFR